MLFYSAWALKALYFKLQSPIYTKDFIQALFSMAKCFLSNIDTHSWSSECIGRNLGFSVTDMQTGEARYWITNLLIGRWPAPPLKPQPHQTLQQICNFCRFTKVNWQIITIKTLIANLTPLNHKQILFYCHFNVVLMQSHFWRQQLIVTSHRPCHNPCLQGKHFNEKTNCT